MVTIRIKNGDTIQSATFDKEGIDILIGFDHKTVCVKDGEERILTYEVKPPTT